MRNWCVRSVQMITSGLVALLLLAGCGSAPVKTGPTLFYPPLPQPPRLQFLARYQSSEDLGGTGGGFRKFVTGEDDPVQALEKPHQASFWRGKIYVCDSRRGEVVVMDLAHHEFSVLGQEEGIRFGKPLAVMIDSKGRKYIADNVAKRVYEFNANDEFQREFGVDGQFGPTGLALFEDRLYIADMLDKEVEVLDLNDGHTLKRLKTFTTADGDTSGRLRMPVNIAVDDKGWLYVSDMLAANIQVFDQDYRHVRTIGRPGDQIGTFGRPRGVAVDRNGFVYVADAAFENIQVFSPEGDPVLFFGGPGTDPGFMYMPSGVTIQYDKLDVFKPYVDSRFTLEFVLLVTNQFGPNGVSVYGFGHLKDGVLKSLQVNTDGGNTS